MPNLHEDHLYPVGPIRKKLLQMKFKDDIKNNFGNLTIFVFYINFSLKS
jgi:hypothetical protein